MECRQNKRTPPTPTTIYGEDVEIVDTYRYLGVHKNNKLEWSDHKDTLCKKGHSRLFFLKRLRSSLCSRQPQIFYQPVIASVLPFTMVCWMGIINTRDKQTGEENKLCCGSHSGQSEVVAEQRMRRKPNSMLENNTHLIHSMLMGMRSMFTHRPMPQTLHKALWPIFYANSHQALKLGGAS